MIHPIKHFLFQSFLYRHLKVLSICLFCSFLASCELLYLIAGPSPSSDIIRSLDLEADWRGNLLGSTVVEGTVRNNHHRNVYSITLRAKAYDNSYNLIEQKDFDLSVTLTPDGEATFKEYLSTSKRNVSNVTVEIISASD